MTVRPKIQARKAVGMISVRALILMLCPPNRYPTVAGEPTLIRPPFPEHISCQNSRHQKEPIFESFACIFHAPAIAGSSNLSPSSTKSSNHASLGKLLLALRNNQ